MDHTRLIEEMRLTAKMPVMERIYLAKRKRIRQLENYRKWDQLDGEISEYDEEHVRKPKIRFSLEVRFFEAVTNGNLHELSTLLEEDIDVNFRNYEGLTPLHQSCIDGYYEIVYLLLQRGAEVNATDMDGWTPLHAAATCGHKNIAKLLVQNGADLLAINADEDMPFEITEDEDVLNFLQREMVYQGITTQMVNEKRHATYSIFRKDIINALDEEGNLDAPITEDGASFLHVAIGYFYNDLVDLLLQRGASPNTTDNEGWRPIHVAAYWGNEVAFKLLVKNYEADIEVQTHAGETPYNLCENHDLQIYIKGLKNSNLNIDYLKIDFLDIHYTMEEQSRSINKYETKEEAKEEIIKETIDEAVDEIIEESINETVDETIETIYEIKEDTDDESEDEILVEEDPPKFRRRSFDEILPILPPIFNPKANELTYDKRTSFREAKKFAPNIKTFTVERLKDGLSDDVIKPNIEERNESTTKIFGNEPQSIITPISVIDLGNQNNLNNKEKIIISELEKENTELHNEATEYKTNNKNNDNIKAEDILETTNHITDSQHHDDNMPNLKQNIRYNISSNSLLSTSSTSLPNTLSSLKKQRIEQRHVSQSSKRFSNIETKFEQNTIKGLDSDNSDILYRFKQTEPYNYTSIVKKKCFCKIM